MLAHSPKLLTEELIEDRLGRGAACLLRRVFAPDLGEFAAIQPMATALRALVHHHPTPNAVEMAQHQLRAAMRALSPPGEVNHGLRVIGTVQESLAYRVARRIDPLQFARVKPYAPAAAFAGIDGQVFDVPTDEYLTTRGTIHLRLRSDDRRSPRPLSPPPAPIRPAHHPPPRLRHILPLARAPH